MDKNNLMVEFEWLHLFFYWEVATCLISNQMNLSYTCIVSLFVMEHIRINLVYMSGIAYIKLERLSCYIRSGCACIHC